MTRKNVSVMLVALVLSTTWAAGSASDPAHRQLLLEDLAREVTKKGGSYRGRMSTGHGHHTQHSLQKFCRKFGSRITKRRGTDKGDWHGRVAARGAAACDGQLAV